METAPTRWAAAQRRTGAQPGLRHVEAKARPLPPFADADKRGQSASAMSACSRERPACARQVQPPPWLPACPSRAGLDQTSCYIDSERRAPPDGCGSTLKFATFLDAIANPKHPTHKDATQWHHGCYGHAFHLETIDKLDAKLAVGVIAKRRSAGDASQAKKSA